MSVITLVVGIYIASEAGAPMRERQWVEALAGQGLRGDRYADGSGSWNRGHPGRRQVTLINAHFFAGTDFSYADSRRNLITDGIELMSLLEKQFTIGEATLYGVRYCTPCVRPSQLAKSPQNFKDTFHDCGGLIATVIKSGRIQVDDRIERYRP